MRRERGFLLVFALLLVVLTSLIALGMLNIRKASYAGSVGAVSSLQARSLARSGITDIWTKLSKDPFFPSGVGDRQVVFSFREEVKSLDGQSIGSYTVTVDRTHRLSHNVVRIESLGVVGSTQDSARHRIYTELSTTAGDFRFQVWEEGVPARL